MGGDKLIGSLCGDETEERLGDQIRDAEKDLYMELIDEVTPLPHARELIEELKRRGHAVILVSSAKEEELEHYLELLDARDLVDGWTSSAKPDEIEHYLDLLDARGLADAWTSSGDVEATKPAPDLVEAALDRVGGGPAVMVGDSTWDCEAAKRAGVETLAVLTGGFSEQELREAGATAVFSSIEELRRRLSETALG